MDTNLINVENNFTRKEVKFVDEYKKVMTGYCELKAQNNTELLNDYLINNASFMRCFLEKIKYNISLKRSEIEQLEKQLMNYREIHEDDTLVVKNLHVLYADLNYLDNLYYEIIEFLSEAKHASDLKNENFNIIK